MKKPFNMNARIVKLLGEKNVPNAQSAITELVKNCYDAEGKMGLVLFDCKNEKKTIYIIDNGIGMDEETIDNCWMTIGTDNKELNSKTSDGRILSGAMGIGRLSLDRLGNKTTLYTQKKDSKLINWKVSWSDFEKSQTNVTEVFADLNYTNGTIENEINNLSVDFPVLENLFERYNFDSGTVIKISDLRDEWNDKEISDIIDYLDMIVPPTDISKFSIFSYENPKEEYKRAVPIISDDFDYKLVAKADKNGINIRVHRDEFDSEKMDFDIFNEDKMGEFPYDVDTFINKEYSIDINYGELLPSDKRITNEFISNLVGDFTFELYFMKQSVGSGEKKYPYKDFNEGRRKKWLEDFSGIKIYRDNFRVRPYGEKNTNNFDWLELQERVRKSPAAPSHKSGSWRVRSNQVSGNLSISRIQNPNIEDMSNRQALDENKAFSYLKKLLVAIIQVFEKDRQKIMRSISSVDDKKNPNFELNKKAKGLAKKVVDANKKNSLPSKKTLPEISLSLDEQRILAESYSNREKEYKKEKKYLVNENQLLRVMATTGVTMSSFGHELKSISALLGNRIRILNEVLEGHISKEAMKLLGDQDDNPFILLKDLEKTDNEIKSWISLTLSNIMRDKRNRKNFDLIKCFKNYINIWENITDDNDSQIFMKTSIKEYKYKGFESDFESILGNLFSNSIEAFKRDDAGIQRKIIVDITENDDDLMIDYRDTGPGLSLDIIDSDKIFDHLFTTKRDKDGNEIGTGLGMWIVKNIALDYNGSIIIKSPRDPFNLIISLPKYRGVR